MSFLDEVTISTGAKVTRRQKASGFLDNVILPTSRTQELFALRREVAVLETEAQRQASFGGMLKETGRDIFGKVKQAAITFGTSLFEAYKHAPEKFVEDVTAGAEDIRKGKLLKGVVKAGFRTSLDVAGVIYAPISAAIGAGLELTGGQQLIDKTGEVIADRSGITNLPAFQKFAIEHPNAGEDFERLLLLFLARGEKGRIDPARIAKEARTFANKLVFSEKPPPPPGGAAGALVPTVPVLPKTKFFQKVEIPSGEVIELSAPQQRLLLKAGERPVIEPTKVPVYRKTQITRNTELNKGDIIAIEEIGNWVVSDIKIRQTPRGKEKIAVLKDSEGNIFEESVLDLTGARQIRKVGERPAPVAKAPPRQITPKAEKTEPVTRPRTSIFKEEIGRIPEKPVAAPIETRPITGEKPSKVGLSIEQRAIEKKLTEGFGGTAGFDPITIKEQARLVSELIAKDIERAKRMARGEEPVPDNLRGSSLIVGLEEYAFSKGDVGLLQDLSKTPLISQTSRFGQEIRILAERSPESPVTIIQDLAKAKETRVETQTKKKITEVKKTEVNELKTEIKKSVSPRPKWEEFIREVSCNF